MGFTEVLTIVLVVLKATDRINCSWFVVFLPEIIAFAFYAVAAVVAVVFGANLFKSIF